MGENIVDVDPAALATEAQAIADGAAGPASSSTPPSSPDSFTAAPGAPAAAGRGAPAPIAGELTYEQLKAIAARSSEALVGFVFEGGKIIAPNWGITFDESKRLGHLAAVALAAWCPTGVIPIKYMVLLNLAGAVYGVANERRDPVTGELPPLKTPAKKPAENGAATPA